MPSADRRSARARRVRRPARRHARGEGAVAVFDDRCEQSWCTPRSRRSRCGARVRCATFPPPASPSTIRATSRIECERTGTDVQRARQRSGGSHHLHDHVDCVVDEREVAALLTVVLDGQFAGGADLGDEARHHGIEALVGSVDVEEAERGGLRARPRVHVGEVLERDLAHRVRRARRETRRFGDGLTRRLARRTPRTSSRRATATTDARDTISSRCRSTRTLRAMSSRLANDAGTLLRAARCTTVVTPARSSNPEIEHVDAVDGTVGRPQRLGRGEVVDTEHRDPGGAQRPAQVAPDESGRARDEHHLVTRLAAPRSPRTPPHSSPPR